MSDPRVPLHLAAAFIAEVSSLLLLVVFGMEVWYPEREGKPRGDGGRKKTCGLRVFAPGGPFMNASKSDDII